MVQHSSDPVVPLLQVPVLPLRDVVVYPHMVIPLFVGREKSIQALDIAMRENKKILLLAQKDKELDEPGFDDLYRVGTLANILQMLKLPDGTVKVLVEGSERASVSRIEAIDGYFVADAVPQLDEVSSDERELDILTRTIISMFDQYVKLNKKIPPEVLNSLAGIDEPGPSG